MVLDGTDNCSIFQQLSARTCLKSKSKPFFKFLIKSSPIQNFCFPRTLFPFLFRTFSVWWYGTHTVLLVLVLLLHSNRVLSCPDPNHFYVECTRCTLLHFPLTCKQDTEKTSTPKKRVWCCAHFLDFISRNMHLSSLQVLRKLFGLPPSRAPEPMFALFQHTSVHGQFNS